MYAIEWLSPAGLWHTHHFVNNEMAAMQAALRLSNSGHYRAVRVRTRDGAVIFSL